MITREQRAHSRYIGIKQAKRTIQKIERRARLGKPRPTDQQLLQSAQATIRKLEAER